MVASAGDAEAVYEPDERRGGNGEHFVATRFAQGPWHPDSQHGGAACGLLARMLEREPTLVPMRYARISFDLMRIIPLGPVRASARIVREGKRVQLVEASLVAGETEVARATGQRIRLEPGLDTGTHIPAEQPLPFEPGEGSGPVIRVDSAPGYIHALDFVRGDGEPDGKGARTAWLRVRLPFVAGEQTSPLMQLAACCDFASGVSSALDFSRFSSINPDVSLHIHRYPETEWIALRGTTELHTDGTGQSEAEIFDEHGRIARALTSLLVSRAS
jgi:hypothetical protein